MSSIHKLTLKNLTLLRALKTPTIQTSTDSQQFRQSHSVILISPKSNNGQSQEWKVEKSILKVESEKGRFFTYIYTMYILRPFSLSSLDLRNSTDLEIKGYTVFLDN